MLEQYVAWIGMDLAFQDIQVELDGLPGDYAPPTGGLLVADDAGRLVGMIGVRPFEGPVCEMKRLFVRPEGRGRGLARLLIAHLLDEARALHYTEIRLDTLPMMRPAQALYASLGFTDIPPYYDTPIAGTRFMSKALKPLE